MSHPKELLDRVAIERVAQAGVRPQGPAVPEASPKTLVPFSRQPASPVVSENITQTPARPAQPPVEFGAVADPVTAVPVVGMPADVRPVEPVTQPPARPVGVTTFAGAAATPSLIQQIVGIPAEVRRAGPVEVVASPSPEVRVTVTVPPALPFAPEEALRMVDEQLSLPPWRMIGTKFDIAAPGEEDLESTEAYVARSYQQHSGQGSDVDRWVL